MLIVALSASASGFVVRSMVSGGGCAIATGGGCEVCVKTGREEERVGVMGEYGGARAGDADRDADCAWPSSCVFGDLEVLSVKDGISEV